MKNLMINEDNFMFGFVLGLAIFFVISFCFFSDQVIKVVKMVIKFFDPVSIPQEEMIVGKLVSCRKRKELDLYYSLDSNGVFVQSYSILTERHFLVVKESSKKAVVKILTSEKVYDTMSKRKGQMISLFCQKNEGDNYNLIT